MKKYKVTKWGGAKIEEVEVIRETEKCVFFNGYRGEHRAMKVTGYDNWFDTWGEAHAYLMEKAERLARQARVELDRANGLLGNVKGMRQSEAKGSTSG